MVFIFVPLMVAVLVVSSQPALAADLMAGLGYKEVLHMALLGLLIVGLIFPVRWLMERRKVKELADGSDVSPSEGIRGWLLVFVVLSALSVLRDIFLAFPQLLNTGRTYPELARGMNFYLVFNIFYDCVWLYGIYIIYAVKPHAVRFIKILLLASPLVAAVSPVIMSIFVQATLGEQIFNPNLISKLYTAEVLGGIGASLLGAIIWFTYFCRSQRVRNTWGENMAYRGQLLR